MAEFNDRQNAVIPPYMAERNGKRLDAAPNADGGKKEMWSDRLVEERAELGDRLERLENFMFTDAAHDRLDREDQDLLLLQHEYMRRYAEVLDLRLVRAATHRNVEAR